MKKLYKEIYQRRKSQQKNNKEMDMIEMWEMPEWIKEDGSKLMTFYEKQELFYDQGRLSIGCIVQANELLFTSGEDDCPANIIYSEDPYYLDNPGELDAMARILFSLKGHLADDPEVQVFADTLATEVDVVFRLPLPNSVTGGRKVFFTTIMVHRDYIPKGILTERLYPVLTVPGEGADAMILPKWYWEDLIRDKKIDQAMESLGKKKKKGFRLFK